MKKTIALLFLCGQALAGPYLGDYNAGDTICGYFNTYQPSTGASFTLASGAAQAFKDNSATQDTSGITLDNDFDSITGYHQVCIDTSADGTFFSAGSRFSINLSAGTVDSVSVVGSEVFSFSILDGTQATAQTDLDSLTNGEILVATTIAGLTDQRNFTLTAGSADNNAYNNKIIVVTDSATATQKAVGKVLDYTGSTKAVLLTFDPGVFTMAVGDTVVILSVDF